MNAYKPEYCPHFHRAIEVIGRRWTGPILKAMLGGRTRFTDIRDAVPGLSDRLLSERLKALEELGVINRCTEARDVHYQVTEVGRQVEPVFVAVADWAKQLASVTPLPEP